jgi:tetratricopeptide (TPR) repeat protein
LPPDTDAAVDAPTEFSSVARTEPRVTESVPRQTPRPSAVTTPKPTPKPSIPKPTPKPAAKKPAASAPTTNWVLVGGAAVVALVLIAIVVVRMRKPSAPENTARQRVETLLADARSRIDRNDCVGALSDAIDPALALEPNNVDALALKTRASACVPPPPPPAPVPVVMSADEIGEHLRVADEAIARRECDAALAEHINKVLEQEPTNPKAVELKAKAEACPPIVVKAPSATAAAAPKLAVKIPAESGGIEPNSGELDKDYQVRVKAMKARYDEAVGILASGAYARAIPALQGIVREAGNRYLDAAAKLTEARKGAAAQAIAEARDAESKNDYDQAVQALRRAAAADPDPRIEEDLKRIGEKRMQAGLKACDDGKNAYAFNRPQQALQFYQQVVRLLPPDHPCTVTAKERIAALTR